MNKKNINLPLSFFNLVDPSPVAILGAFILILFSFFSVCFAENCYDTFFIINFSLASTNYILGCWWRDVLIEYTYTKRHPSLIQAVVILGETLFITIEVLLFFGCLLAFFNVGTEAGIEDKWLPFELEIIGPWGLPFVNSILLLTSGATITAAHHYMIKGNIERTGDFLALTIHLAIIFLYFQASEYKLIPFNFSDSVYAACFFLTTGFHLLYVFLGTCFLFAMLYRLNQETNLTREDHMGLELAILYWHFVDVVWLLLFLAIYWLGS